MAPYPYQSFLHYIIFIEDEDVLQGYEFDQTRFNFLTFEEYSPAKEVYLDKNIRCNGYEENIKY